MLWQNSAVVGRNPNYFDFAFFSEYKETGGAAC